MNVHCFLALSIDSAIAVAGLHALVIGAFVTAIGMLKDNDGVKLIGFAIAALTLYGEAYYYGESLGVVTRTVFSTALLFGIVMGLSASVSLLLFVFNPPRPSSGGQAFYRYRRSLDRCVRSGWFGVVLIGVSFALLSWFFGGVRQVPEHLIAFLQKGANNVAIVTWIQANHYILSFLVWTMMGLGFAGPFAGKSLSRNDHGVL